VARLRAYGEVVPDWSRIDGAQMHDLAAFENGGQAVCSNDQHFGSMHNLLLPGRGKDMGDGWETRRRRAAGHDFVVLRLGRPGTIERVDSIQPSPVLGDTQTATLYTGYRDHGGVKFPGRIRQTMGGFGVLDLEVKTVEPNAAVAIEVPALVQSFAERVVAEKAADGVWFLSGGSHNSVLIEMKDHLMLVESPLYDGRALAVIAEARRLGEVDADEPLEVYPPEPTLLDLIGALGVSGPAGLDAVLADVKRALGDRAARAVATAIQDVQSFRSMPIQTIAIWPVVLL
jgi:hypothetical protein